VAAAAFVPTVLAASPALLQADGFADLALAGDLGEPFRAADYARWRALATREDMRFVAIALPRLLARAPWDDDARRADGFRYVEDAPTEAERVWMTAGFAFAAVAARAFATHAWPADVRGSETDRIGGGLVDAAPYEPFASDANWFRPALDIVLTDRQERALTEAGLMPLSALPFGQQAVFSAVRSLQSPARYADGKAVAANANGRLSSQINAMLCVSRFAHYVKLKGRDMVGAFRTADEIERHLHDWLQGYVNGNAAGGSEGRARFPLVAASVAVRERAGRPGVFGCTIHLQPHFQLDDVSATFRLATDIAAPGAQ
jgi:type VI secretion system protein ImpD/type VI secretion system protein ImpC